MEMEKEVDLAVRKAIAEEVSQYREHLQSQFKHVLYLIALIITVGASLGVYFFGKSFTESKEKLVEVIDQKVVEYRINEDLKKRVNVYMETAVERTVDSDSTSLKIDALINKKATAYIEKSAERIDERLKSTVSAELEKIEGLDVDALLIKTAMPAGAVMAFAKAECPAGWGIFKDAHGRTIIGAGKGDNVLVKTLFEKGGEEKHALTINEIPRHQHDTVIGVTRPTAKWGMGNKIKTTMVSKYDFYPSGKTSYVGGSEEHNNMPPYIALRYCVKK